MENNYSWIFINFFSIKIIWENLYVISSGIYLF